MRFYYEPEQLKKFDLKIASGRVSGTFHLERDETQYKGELSGVIEAKDGKVTRFDLLAKGLQKYPPAGKNYQPVGGDVPFEYG